LNQGFAKFAALPDSALSAFALACPLLKCAPIKSAPPLLLLEFARRRSQWLRVVLAAVLFASRWVRLRTSHINMIRSRHLLHATPNAATASHSAHLGAQAL
jgi:hypothetical protein